MLSRGDTGQANLCVFIQVTLESSVCCNHTQQRPTSKCTGYNVSPCTVLSLIFCTLPSTYQWTWAKQQMHSHTMIYLFFLLLFLRHPQSFIPLATFSLLVSSPPPWGSPDWTTQFRDFLTEVVPHQHGLIHIRQAEIYILLHKVLSDTTTINWSNTADLSHFFIHHPCHLAQLNCIYPPCNTCRYPKDCQNNFWLPCHSFTMSYVAYKDFQCQPQEGNGYLSLLHYWDLSMHPGPMHL